MCLEVMEKGESTKLDKLVSVGIRGKGCNKMYETNPSEEDLKQG